LRVRPQGNTEKRRHAESLVNGELRDVPSERRDPISADPIQKVLSGLHGKDKRYHAFES
jgi:hypothetical protein